MDVDAETVASDALWSDMLFEKQRQQVDGMRSAIMECDDSDPFSVQNSMRKILVMRIYHQVTRIIRYTEEMDKIERKLYESIDYALDNIAIDDEQNVKSLNLLLNIQEKLQRSMIESQKLLDPYLNMKELTYIDVPSPSSGPDDSINGHVLDQASRKRLREGAKAALDVINLESDGSREPMPVE